MVLAEMWLLHVNSWFVVAIQLLVVALVIRGVYFTYPRIKYLIYVGQSTICALMYDQSQLDRSIENRKSSIRAYHIFYLIVTITAAVCALSVWLCLKHIFIQQYLSKRLAKINIKKMVKISFQIL